MLGTTVYSIETDFLIAQGRLLASWKWKRTDWRAHNTQSSKFVYLARSPLFLTEQEQCQEGYYESETSERNAHDCSSAQRGRM